MSPGRLGWHACIDRLVAVRFQCHGDGIKTDHVAEPEQGLFDNRSRVDVGPCPRIEHFEDRAALVDHQACVPGLDTAEVEPDRIVLRGTNAGDAALDEDIRMFSAGKT